MGWCSQFTSRFEAVMDALEEELIALMLRNREAFEALPCHGGNGHNEDASTGELKNEHTVGTVFHGKSVCIILSGR